MNDLAATANRTYYTPPQLAKLWGVAPDKVVRFIRAGELRAIDLSQHQGGRPRYRIAEADKIDFERRRAASPPPPAPRRTARPTTCKNYF